MAPSTLAHTIKASGNVAATFHIQPNHNPKAGEAAQAWFALTRQGGKPIPLTECNCQLEVNLKSHSQGTENPQPQRDSPSLKPPLKPISAEQYQEIPGAEIVFPQAGEYELKFSGTAKPGADFQPFAFTYTVTVRAGINLPQVTPLPQTVNNSKDETSTKESSSQWQIPVFILVALLGLGGIGFVVRWLKMVKFYK
ncbi:MAG TPA: hypothetical protein DEG17_03330 [Cyanobacteria bacterium UBA11149]|nr:hypothetical protein [Cyanobacteria bacterium UBA11367]HBE56059.1 hypothetical protein [Cyanobacteria bacterium UBA11366]HBK64544.1 hypothetical protein [Cyanobacteria bacterium UBA11166]HBR77018.1 hypothetical protein [Cyanobacteria bacterium UBA11159]HBS70983.1 hypothetical protein [Cyanobacteria bacterium UBA11153]HBW87939.1 hypothetical protein [Cyanobacteria bacterium UBA11149]HCA97815.1 hypothetical protein [Cyanobacteria bacterium UBA9226]